MDSTRARILRAKKLGVLIRDARLASGRSRKAIAEVLGISPSQLAAYERGDKAPSLPELEALAYHLHLPVEHFFGSDVLTENESGEDIEERLGRLIQIRQRIVGALLRQAREDAGLSLAEVSRQTEIPKSRLRDYELGERPVPLPDLEALAALYGLSLQHFMDRDGPIGTWLAQQRQVANFLELPPELRAFVAKPVNRPYLELAQRLSEMSVEKLRAVAEGLLEITL
ncbi:MAG: helix-turn-helix domain-containing protein [Chloroflexi bacterium]|nr:helix-turn-helix domain-containing protein [Chloroflexota bacterium]